ncbi:acyl-CoA thioesterase [Myroides sp. LJL119]
MITLDISEFKYFYPIEIRWNDLDALGHVNNVLYIDYFQNARGGFMPVSCKDWDWQKHMFVIANIHCEYLKEIRINAMAPQVGVRVSHFGGKSFKIQYVIISKDSNDQNIIHAHGFSTQVMIDLQNKTSIELPQWFVNQIKDFQGDVF